MIHTKNTNNEQPNTLRIRYVTSLEDRKLSGGLILGAIDTRPPKGEESKGLIGQTTRIETFAFKPC